MPRQARRGTNICTRKVANGFCISCAASKSSRFRSAPSKWEAFYQFYNEERNEKKKRICSNCYLKLSKACKASTISNEQGSSATNHTDSNTTGQISVVVKPSPIGGNGLFALRDFVKGEVVAHYGGRILSLKETEGKDPSYMRVIGLDKNNGVIDGKYGFGSSLGRYVNSPPKGKYPNCTWGKYNETTKTIAIKTNKAVQRGEEFMIRYGFQADRMLRQ